MKKFLLTNWIIAVMSTALLISTALAVRNTYTIDKNQLMMQQAELVKESTQQVLTKIVHGLDLGVRGYALTRDEKLLAPYREAVKITPAVFKKIDSLLAIQNYSDRPKAKKVMDELTAYIRYCNEMIAMADHGEMESLSAKLKEDRGYEVWNQYSGFATPLFAYEDNLRKQALEEYNVAIRTNFVLQVAMSVFGLPLLFYFLRRIARERESRTKVLQTVDEADRNYVFNNGLSTQFITEEINNRSLEHIKIASEFVASLAEDKYDVEWRGMTSSNDQLNKKTLAGNLVRLRERLKVVKIEDQRRNWVNEGLARFSEIVRSHQHSQDKLVNESISFLTKYIKAQQGSLFVVHTEDQETFLKLEGCFAFDRKKWIEKKISIGNGLIGQVYLEGGSILLTELPQGYTSITSGLGEATPNCIAIVPMKNNSEIAAIGEFATFGAIKEYELNFLEKAGEFLASTIINAKNSAKMKNLLDQATEREVLMREREEELRQNMEELQATQEQMQRNMASGKLGIEADTTRHKAASNGIVH